MRSLAIVCTDRGQHKKVRMTTVVWRSYEAGAPDKPVMLGLLMGTASGSIRRGNFVPPWVDGNPLRPAGSPADGSPPPPGWSRSSYDFWCPKCGRTTRIRAERWWQIVDGARRVGMTEFDLSALD